MIINATLINATLISNTTLLSTLAFSAAKLSRKLGNVFENKQNSTNNRC